MRGYFDTTTLLRCVIEPGLYPRNWDLLRFVPYRVPLESFYFISLKFFAEKIFIPHGGTTLKLSPWVPNRILFLSYTNLNLYIFPMRLFLDFNLLAAFCYFLNEKFLKRRMVVCCWRIGDEFVSWRSKKNILFANIPKTIINIFLFIFLSPSRRIFKTYSVKNSRKIPIFFSKNMEQLFFLVIFSKFLGL